MKTWWLAVRILWRTRLIRGAALDRRARAERWDTDAAEWQLSPAEYAHYLTRISAYQGRLTEKLRVRAELLRYRSRVHTRAALVFAGLSVISFTVDFSMYGVLGMALEVMVGRG
jgi:hypothetical protein